MRKYNLQISCHNSPCFDCTSNVDWHGLRLNYILQYVKVIWYDKKLWTSIYPYNISKKKIYPCNVNICRKYKEINNTSKQKFNYRNFKGFNFYDCRSYCKTYIYQKRIKTYKDTSKDQRMAKFKRIPWESSSQVKAKFIPPLLKRTSVRTCDARVVV